MSAITTKQLALVFIIVAALAGASNPVAAKYALAVMGPFTVLTLRFFFATVCLLYPVYKAKEFSSKQFSFLLPVATFGALNPILLFVALQFTQASFSPLIYAGVPAMTAIYLLLRHQKKVSTQTVFGIILGLTGVALTVILPRIQTGFPANSLFGNMLIFLASLAFTAYSIVSKQKQSEMQVTPLALTFYFCLVTLLISIPFTAFELLTRGISPEVSWVHLASGVYMGVVATGIFYLAYQYAIKHASSVTASLFTYLQPVFGIVLAAAILGEVITWPFLLGGTLAVVGAAIAAGKK